MEITTTLYVHTAAAWRAWLRKHHANVREIWLVYYKKRSGKARIPYNDAVDQALCFGWIDSITKTIDEERWAQRFTPRRKGSPLSEMNKARVRRMIREKQMTAAGLKALEHSLGDAARIHRGKIRDTRPWSVPADILATIKKDNRAWKHFQRLPLAYKRIRIAYIEGARHRPDILRSRLAYFIRMTAQGKRFGMIHK
ncbi:MAG: YdeI/OmpD-associated family protein [Gemmatimonadetes bacterium]|nr:YdeI/OmpD-associated family protein [Gemmatimonadota bacterium]